MSDETPDKPTKLVIDNTTPEGRQRQLEANVQLTFAEMFASIVEFIANRDAPGLMEKIERFYDAHVEGSEFSIDPKGIAIRMPVFYEEPDEKEPDASTNRVTRGAMRMVAARIMWAAQGGDLTKLDDSPHYRKAHEEFAKGIMSITNRAMSSERARRSNRDRLK